MGIFDDEDNSCSVCNCKVNSNTYHNSNLAIAVIS